MATDYVPPVSHLLTLGDTRKEGNREWPNYLEYDITEEHVPELIRMASDEDLSVSENSLEHWAPVHAWRALGQLRAEAAIEPLTRLIRVYEDDDWASEELPVVLGMIGPAALPHLAHTLEAEARPVYSWPPIAYAHAISEVGARHPEARDESISLLSKQLARCVGIAPDLNGFLVSYLMDLRAVEALPAIREAFGKGCVKVSIPGDLEDVEIRMGVREKRDTPPPRYHYFDLPDDTAGEPASRFAYALKPHERPGTMRQTPKVGRNDPCPCGSGKKYKKCCLGKTA